MQYILTANNGMCNISDTVMIYPDTPMAINFVTTPVSCAANDGTITANITGGTSPYSYLWSNGRTDQTILNLSAGTYTCVATSAIGCTASVSSTLAAPVCWPTQLTSNYCGGSMTLLTTPVTCVTVSGATNYQWHIWDPSSTFNVTLLKGSSTANYLFSSITGIRYGRTYNVEIKAYKNNTWGAYGNLCTITTPAFPLTKLTSTYCGGTLTTLATNVTCIAIPAATNYQWHVWDPSGTFNMTFNKGSGTANYNFSTITGIQYGKTYNVQVRGYLNGDWGSFGATCTLTTPAFPQTKLTAAACGSTMTNLATAVPCISVPAATNYQWHIWDTTSTFNVTLTKGSATASYVFSTITGIQYNKTYNVRVRAYAGGVWGPYGATCTIKTPAFPTTKLTSAYCNGSIPTVHTLIYCTAIPAATNYQWRITNPSLGYSSTKNKGSNATSWNLTTSVGILINTTYNVEVRGYVGGVWGSFGPVCTISTGSSYRMKQDTIEDPIVSITEMKVYPNPNSGSDFYLEFNNTDQKINEMNVQILDLTGKLIFDKKYIYDGSKIEVTLDKPLSSGIYLIRAIIGDETSMGKLIVE